MGSAALPAGSGQVRRNSFDRAGVGVGGDEPDPGQAAGDEVGEERVPRTSGFGGGDLQSQNLSVPVAVDPGGDVDDGVDHPAALTHLHDHGVGRDERERAGIAQGTVPELVDVFIEVCGHAGDLGLRQAVDAEGLDELVHPARGDAGEVAVGDHRDQGGFCSFAALQEPLGK